MTVVRVLSYTTLYPDSTRPRHGIFVENRLRHLKASGEVDLRVIAPVPWFPSTNPRFGEYAAFARVPEVEEWHEIRVTHPRHPLLPKIGMSVAPALMAAWTLPAVRRVMNEGYEFDILDAHYFYPDGIAAMMIGRILRKPVVITARGTDLNLISRFRLPRSMIRWAAGHADGLITVCETLKKVLIDLGVPSERIHVLRNGVDLSMFMPPLDRRALRQALDVQGPVLFSVGHLVDLKGHDLAIRAAHRLPDAQLLIAGAGKKESSLRRLVSDLSMSGRVRFLGEIPHAELPRYYGAADALVLASSREGWPNVLLEAMACGTPVVATPVGGVPEIVSGAEAGVITSERSVPAIVSALNTLFSNYPNRHATRRHAEHFSWETTTMGQLQLFSDIVQKGLRNA